MQGLVPSRIVLTSTMSLYQVSLYQEFTVQVEFLLCYAMAGGHARICMLRCDAPDSCITLSGDHNIYAIRGRLKLLRIAVLLYRILTIQQTQLPSDAVPLGSELEFSGGTTITIMEDYIIKRVGILLTSWQSFKSCTEQQELVSTSYVLRKVHTFALDIQLFCLLLVISFVLVLSLLE